MNNKYAIVVDGVIVKYPVYFSELPDLLGHNRLTIDEFAKKNIYVVFGTEHENKWNKKYEEGAPVFDGNVWHQTWVELDADQEQIDNRLSWQWEDIRHMRNKLLAISDYTQLPDCQLSDEEKQAFAEYRQQLRDITEQPDPFDIWFPASPKGND